VKPLNEATDALTKRLLSLDAGFTSLYFVFTTVDRVFTFRKFSGMKFQVLNCDGKAYDSALAS